MVTSNEPLSVAFKGYRMTLEGGFAEKFFGVPSPDSVIRVMDNRIYFWLVDPDTGDCSVEANVWQYNWNDKDLGAVAEDNASRIKDVEYVGEETIGSYQVFGAKNKEDKKSSVWHSMYFEANGNKFNISGTFKDMDTIGKFVDLLMENITVEAE